LKILHVLNTFLPSHVGGTEIYVSALVRELQKKGVEGEVIIPNFGSAQNGYYLYNNIGIHKYSEFSKPDRQLIQGKKIATGVVNFMSLVKKILPDIVHFHEISGSNGISVQHMRLVKEAGYKTMMTFHVAGNTCKTGTMMQNSKLICDGVVEEKKCAVCFINHQRIGLFSFPLYEISLFIQMLGIKPELWHSKMGTALSANIVIREFMDRFKLLEKHTDRMIVLADWYENVLHKNGLPAQKIIKIRQGLIQSISLQQAKNEIENTPIRLLYIGRIAWQKGLLDLLEALSGLNPKKYTLDIYGYPGDQSYFSKVMKKVETMDNVAWKGGLNADEVIDTIRQYDVFCLCSAIAEMSSLAIQEVFAAGITIVASDVPGNQEQIIHEENGLLYEFNDKVSLQKQLKRLTEDEKLYKALRSKKTNPRKFEEVASEYAVVYNELVNQKN